MNEKLFIETMRVVDGRIANIDGHISRMRSTCREVFGNERDLASLRELAVPDDAQKCRIVYGKDIVSIEFSDYVPRQIRTLKLVEADADLDYHLKYADRSALNALTAGREDCDEILIVKDGLITDTSYTNVVFTDGNCFFTPDSPLLPGTMRASLLKAGVISEATISVDDIKRYTHIALINAMLPLNALPLIPIGNIQQ
jgi:4-amino-4-deoxychorismate lyase